MQLHNIRSRENDKIGFQFFELRGNHFKLRNYFFVLNESLILNSSF